MRLPARRSSPDSPGRPLRFGRLSCAHGADLDLERCFRCPLLHDVQPGDGGLVLSCGRRGMPAPSLALRDDPFDFLSAAATRRP